MAHAHCIATCFDSYESSSGINILELLVHIVLQFFLCLSRTIAVGIPIAIPKATNTHRLCNTYCFSNVIIVAWTPFSVTLYIQCPSCSCLSACTACCHLKVELYLIFLSSYLLMMYPKSIIRCYISIIRPVQYLTYREHSQISAACRLLPGWLHWPTVCRA